MISSQKNEFSKKSLKFWIELSIKRKTQIGLSLIPVETVKKLASFQSEDSKSSLPSFDGIKFELIVRDEIPF